MDKSNRKSGVGFEGGEAYWYKFDEEY